jgi:acyl-CoA synthetase (AMP-forming)/AMP-acid ligase II
MMSKIINSFPTASTFLEILEKRASDEPRKSAFRFFHDSPCRYGDLWTAISRTGAYLLRHGLKPNGRVLISIPNSTEFFYAFYGVQRSGGVAVPVFTGSGADRMLKLANLCGAEHIIISEHFPATKLQVLEQWAQKHGGTILKVEDAFRAPLAASFPSISPGDTAFIQFTSGSTGDPKGVMLSHEHLIVNCRQMIEGLQITPSDRFVSWLPVYHDMGLILMTMVPLYLGLQLELLPTGLNYFKTWLTLIDDQKATFTAAPDFAYRLCLIYVRDPENYNLSSLRVAMDAAEPVRAATCRRFEDYFSLKNVMLPAYGLAEATVGVCGRRPGQSLKVDKRGFVSVGKPFPGIDVRISETSSAIKFPDRRSGSNIIPIGEIMVRSEANCGGYFQNPSASRSLLTEDGFIHTGDLGYIDREGDVFIVGRKKNIIVQGGFNLASREVEELVDALPFVRRSAAVGIDRRRAEGEQVYIFAETKTGKTDSNSEAAQMERSVSVVRQFHESFGFHPGRVYLLKSGAIPMTYNGKIRYSQLVNRFLDGSLKKDNQILFPDY